MDLSTYAPPKDPTFDVLFGLALSRDLLVYFGAVPLDALAAFSSEFNFLDAPNGRAIVSAIISEAQQGRLPRLWAYERDDVFVVSDDYAQLEAYKIGRPDYAPCWILGRPRNKRVKDVQGPVDARKAAGLA